MNAFADGAQTIIEHRIEDRTEENHPPPGSPPKPLQTIFKNNNNFEWSKQGSSVDKTLLTQFFGLEI